MRILITGGAGFIGSALTESLLRQGYYVTVIDDFSSGKLPAPDPNLNLITGDITDPLSLEKAFGEVDFCYHLAAVASVKKSIDNWVDSHRVNLTGTIGVFLEASKRKIPVIYASSAAVYGDSQNLPSSEDGPLKFISPYGADKYSCEMQAKVFNEIHGLKTIGLRFFNVYGPGQDPSSPYSGVISIFNENIKRGLPINLYGDGTRERDFIFIDDVVRCLTLAKENITDEPEVYNVCSGVGSSIGDLMGALFKIYGKKVKVNFLPSREGDIARSLGDPRKAEKSIGFSFTTALSQGLEKLAREV